MITRSGAFREPHIERNSRVLVSLSCGPVLMSDGKYHNEFIAQVSWSPGNYYFGPDTGRCFVISHEFVKCMQECTKTEVRREDGSIVYEIK